MRATDTSRIAESEERLSPCRPSGSGRSCLRPSAYCALGIGLLLLACGSNTFNPISHHAETNGQAPPAEMEGVQPRGPASPMPPHDRPPDSSSLAPVDDLDWLTDEDLAFIAECARHRGGVDPCTELPPEFDFAWVGGTTDAAFAALAAQGD